MSNLICCILKTKEEFFDYEKGIYENFTKRAPDYWITKNYNIVDNCRMQSQIDYKDLIVYAVKDNNKIIAGGCVNYNTKNKLQLEEVGFSLTGEMKKLKYCEALLLYIYKNIEDNVFKVALDLRNFIINDLNNRGFDCVYGVCSENKKNFIQTSDLK